MQLLRIAAILRARLKPTCRALRCCALHIVGRQSNDPGVPLNVGLELARSNRSDVRVAEASECIYRPAALR